MIKHVVLLNWKAGISQKDIDTVTASFARLKHEIKEIRSYEFGRDIGLYSSNASYALLAEFDSVADFKAYVVHPKHQELLSGIVAPKLDSFQSAQFELSEQETDVEQ